MKRSPETSRAHINIAINDMRSKIEIIVEHTDPIALQKMLLDIYSKPLKLSDLCTEGFLRDAAPRVLQAEQKLLDEYNDYKRLTHSMLKSGYREDILKYLDASRAFDAAHGLKRELSPTQDLATDFSLGVESLGGGYGMVYTLYAFTEILRAFPDRELSEAEKLNDKGYKLAQQGKYAAALDYYRQAVEISPNFHLAWTNAGIALKNLGEYRNAIACYDYVIDNVDRNYKKAWHNKAVALLGLGEIEEALACCKKALDIDPFYEMAIRLRSEIEDLLEGTRRTMLFPDYEILKAKHPDYDYSFALNGQVNPSNLPLTHKAILDCGYMRESFGSPTFRELLGSAVFGGVENTLIGVPSFNMAFDQILEGARQNRDIFEASWALCILTYRASGIQDGQKIIEIVDEFISARTGPGGLTDSEGAELQFALHSRETKSRVQSDIAR